MTFHALNPDNALECRAVAKLFANLYGDDPTMSPLCDPRFWNEHAGRHLVSLIARRDGQVVAHVAFGRDPLFAVQERNPLDPTRLSLKYAAIAPEALDAQEQLAAAILLLAMQTADRQGARVLESFVLSPRAEQVRFGTAILGDNAVTALLPNFSQSLHGALPLIISQRELRSIGATVATVHHSSNPRIRFSPHTRHPFLVFDTVPFDIHPYLSGHDVERPGYVMIDRSQAHLTQAIRQIIDAGYLPTGIMLHVDGLDRLVFSRFAPELQGMHTDAARALAAGATGSLSLSTGKGDGAGRSRTVNRALT